MKEFAIKQAHPEGDAAWDLYVDGHWIITCSTLQRALDFIAMIHEE